MPDGTSAWVPSKQDNIKRGTLRSGLPLTHDMTIRMVASRIDMTTRTEDLASRVDYDNAGIPSAAAFDPRGLYLFTALEGSREVAVTDVWARREILRFAVGRAPQGLVVSPDGLSLYVIKRMDRTVTVHSLADLMAGGEAPIATAATLAATATEKLTATVLKGKQFFYDSRDAQDGLQQYVSCAACHNDGAQDGRVWDFTGFGEGLRNTITLRGHGGTAQGALHWSGNFDEVQDFEGQIRGFAGGTGLIDDVSFHTGTRDTPLGTPKAGVSADLDALAAYVASLTTEVQSHPQYRRFHDRGSHRREGMAPDADCQQCHTGTGFTNSAVNVFANIGTIKPTSGNRLGGTLSGFEHPHAPRPLEHRTLPSRRFRSDHFRRSSGSPGVTLTATDLTNLIACLGQIDPTETSAPAPAAPRHPPRGLGERSVSVSVAARRPSSASRRPISPSPTAQPERWQRQRLLAHHRAHRRRGTSRSGSRPTPPPPPPTSATPRPTRPRRPISPTALPRFAPADQSTQRGSAASLQLSASDPDGNALASSAAGLPTGLTIGSGTGLIWRRRRRRRRHQRPRP